ncbi:hypothetical protein OOK31_01430 [Streptomyces sp. NBC_00249]|uniref:hypothetical protein n=1 Tax=Streptomyces sp. NBC_00249 TaxID=2975690 RepID=UPI00225A921F|nr:hypothetical protein [Streptomyces sp. NBC_00249]MCX5192562.1 hypothetical protein [Streptomyces sp. NBC_00249]
MNAKILRIAPVAGLVTLGVLLAGPAATAAPQHEVTAVSAEQHRATGKKGPYSSKSSCESAGKKGHYRSYHCEYEQHKWWLYYTS